MTATKAPLITVGAPGPRNARLTDDGLRLYRWGERDLPSVTTIRRLAGIPHSLHQWSISQVIDRALDDWPGLSAQLKSGTPTAVEAVRAHLRRAATDERDRRGALGTAVHDAAASGRSLLEVSPEVAPYLRQYLAWLASSGAEPLLAERQVWNLAVGYAGTFDLIARFPDGSIWMVDLKTGSGLYSDHGLQLAAYRYAEFVSRSSAGDAGLEDVVDDDATEILRSVTGTAVLHLAAKRWEFHSLRTGQAEWDAYCGLLRFAMWSYEHPDVASFSLGSRKGAA